MMETGNPPRRGGTEHREAGAKNIGKLVFKGSFSFINILNFLVSMGFANRTTLRLKTGNPLHHFPITQYSNVPLFQHSNCGAKWS